MIRDGLYKVAFQTPAGAGAGVVCLSGGKMRGGDSSIYYVGTYNESGNKFTASVATDRHTHGFNSVFGIDRVHINMSGQEQGGTISLQGTAVEAPGVPFQVILMRIAD